MSNRRLLFRRNTIAVAASSLGLLPVAAIPQPDGPGRVGGEFAVHDVDIGIQQTEPAVAMNAVGNFVVVWASGGDIRAQRFRADHTRLGSEFTVNTTTTGVQKSPAIAMAPSGAFIVAWETQASGTSDIAYQRFGANGASSFGEVAVNTITAGSQTQPAIALDADGDAVIAWTSSPTGNGDVKVARFNAVNVLQGQETLVNSLYTTGSQSAPAIDIDAGGRYVVAWEGATATESNEIRARRFSASGVGATEFAVNVTTIGLQFAPAIDVSATGDFVVVWTTADSDEQQLARRFSSADEPTTGEVAVSSPAGFLGRSAVVADADGSFMVIWGQVDTVADVYARRFDSTGTPFGRQFRVNGTTAGTQNGPTLAADADGDAIAVWMSDPGGTNTDIRARRLQGSRPTDLRVLQSDSADAVYTGQTLTYSVSLVNREAPAVVTEVPAIDDAIGVATGLRIIDTPPTGATNVTASGSGWTCTYPAGLVNCTTSATLAPGGLTTPVQVRLTPPNEPGTTIQNAARGSAHQYDDNLDDNFDTESTRVECAPSVVTFSTQEYNDSESNINPQFVVQRAGGLCGTTTVQVDFSAGSATAGADFTDSVQSFSWPDGDSTTRTGSVPVVDDALHEVTESVRLTLQSLVNGELGRFRVAKLNIFDNDPAPRVNFSPTTQTLAENAGLANVTAVLGTVSGRDTRIPLIFGGTATNGTDYFPTATTLTIPAGQLSATTQIEIVDDNLGLEGGETIVVGMGSVAGATPGTAKQHTVTVTDNDAAPSVAFTSAAISADESVARNVVVKLSAPAARDVTVTYTVSGTAVSGDYVISTPSPVTIPAGAGQATVTITPVDDAADEPNETVVLKITGATNATLGATLTHTRTIVDNDPP